VGTRNILAITQTVQCVAGVTAFAVQRIKAELLPRYPNVDDVVALEHGYGCGVAIDAPDAVVPIRTLRHISQNPNFGGEVMVVSLGCEKLQPERLLPPGSDRDERQAEPKRSTWSACRTTPTSASCRWSSHRAPGRSPPAAPERAPPRNRAGQRAGGGRAVRRQRRLQRRHRQPGGGLLHRPAGARRRQRDVQRDHRGARRHRQLTARAATPEVAQAMVREMAWYDAYLQRGSVDRSANTTPGNKAGGLSNIVEKAMGSIVKSGSAPIAGVLAPGEKLKAKGLTYAATPASDFICGTLQLAAGMNLHVFTTGRGTPYGLAAVPVIKVATRSDLARRWHDLMDVNAGTIADGTGASIEDAWAGSCST
jgi:galactarate dehydratase